MVGLGSLGFFTKNVLYNKTPKNQKKLKKPKIIKCLGWISLTPQTFKNTEKCCT